MQAHWIYRFISPKLFVLNVSVLLLGLSCLLPATSQAEMSDDGWAQMRQLAQLAEYIAVDYVEAVKDGHVVNDGEYQEMLEFSQLIVTNISEIQDKSADAGDLTDQAKALQEAIQNKQAIETIRQMSGSLRGTLLALMPQSSLPDRLLSKATVKGLYESQCASCHGAAGGGATSST